MKSIFSKIIDKELPAYIIAENEYALAILALDQVKPGHTLVIPKVQVDHFFEVPEPYYTEVFALSKKVAIAMKQALSCRRVATTTIGLEVPHFHHHLVPIEVLSDLDFTKAQKLPSEIMSDLKERIISCL